MLVRSRLLLHATEAPHRDLHVKARWARAATAASATLFDDDRAPAADAA
jgi:hypothetical protein